MTIRIDEPGSQGKPQTSKAIRIHVIHRLHCSKLLLVPTYFDDAKIHCTLNALQDATSKSHK